MLCKDAKIDSLKQVLSVTTSDSLRYILCRQIGDSYYEGNFDSLLLYYDKSLLLAQQLEDTRSQISTLRSFAYVYQYRKNDYDKSIYYFNETLQLSKNKKDTLAHIYILNDLGELYREKGENVKAVEYLFNANKKAELLNHKHLLTRTWHSLGEIYSDKKEHTTALEYFENALPFTEEEKYKRMRGIILNSIGKSYQYMGNHEEAQSTFDKAIDLFKQLDDNDSQVEVFFNLAKGRVLTKEHNEAIRYYRLALELNKTVGNNNRQVMILAALAETLIKVDDKERAHVAALKGMNLLKKVETKLYKGKLAEILSTTYADLGSYKKAFYYNQLAKEAKDSLQQDAANEKLTEMTVLYEKEKAAVEMERLRVKNTEQKLLLNRSRITIFSTIFLAIIGVLLAFLVNKNMRLKHLKKYKQLRIQLTHDLHDNVSSSLNHIKMMANRLTSNRINDEQKEEHVQQIKTISNEVVGNMYDLIWSLDDSKQSIKDLILKMRDYSSHVFATNDLNYQLKDTITNENIILSAHLKNNIYSIFKEAINNVIKHTSPENVHIHVVCKKNNFLLKITNDTYKMKKVERSSKIGLASIRKRAKDIEGQVEINEENNLFTVRLTVPI